MRFFLLILTLAFLTGCQGPTPPAAPASADEVTELKSRMTEVFGALEMYSVDNELKYPEKLDLLIPKYLDEIPLDPVSRTPVVYETTKDGFLISASGDYSSQEAEAGYPKMNQDGFFVKKASEFPTYE